MDKEGLYQTNQHVLIEKVTKPSCIHCNDIFEHLLAQDPIESEPSRAQIDYAGSGFGTSIILEKRFGTREISRMLSGKLSRSTTIKHIDELEDSGYLWSKPEKGIPPIAYYILNKHFIPSELCATAEFQRSLVSDGTDAVLEMITKQCRFCSKPVIPILEFLPIEKLHFPPEEWSDNNVPDLELYLSRVKVTWECQPHLRHSVFSVNYVGRSEVKTIEGLAVEYNKHKENA